jgi:hypothetical protein
VIGGARLPNGLTGVAKMRDFSKPIAGYICACAEPWPTTELRLGAFVAMVASWVDEHSVTQRRFSGCSGASPYQLQITSRQSPLTSHTRK